MDYTIEVWTIPTGTHYANCDCGWQKVSAHQDVIECYVKWHKASHQEHGDSVEVV